MFLCKPLLALGLAYSIFVSPSFGQGQNLQPQQPSTPRVASPVLRRIFVKHRGFDDTGLNEKACNEEQNYPSAHLEDRPTVETAYVQRKVDDMRKVLKDFWRARGISVEVRTTLTQLPNSARYAVLEFDVDKQQATSTPD